VGTNAKGRGVLRWMRGTLRRSVHWLWCKASDRSPAHGRTKAEEPVERWESEGGSVAMPGSGSGMGPDPGRDPETLVH
jgi:hypothetical protein